MGSALGDLLLFNRSVLGRSSLGADLPGAAAGGQVSCSGWLLGLFLFLAPLETTLMLRSWRGWGGAVRRRKLKSQLVIKMGGDYGK